MITPNWQDPLLATMLNNYSPALFRTVQRAIHIHNDSLSGTSADLHQIANGRPTSGFGPAKQAKMRKFLHYMENRKKRQLSPTYTITPAQIAAAEQAQADFAAILATDPTAKAPANFRQMILNEAHGKTWNISTGQYEPENK